MCYKNNIGIPLSNCISNFPGDIIAGSVTPNQTGLFLFQFEQIMFVGTISSWTMYLDTPITLTVPSIIDNRFNFYAGNNLG